MKLYKQNILYKFIIFNYLVFILLLDTQKFT